jgi:hypothetical protein
MSSEVGMITQHGFLPKTLLIAAACASCGGETTTEPNGNGGPPTVASVAVCCDVTVNTPGEAVELTATALDANNQPIAGKTFTWSSSDETVATVDGSGLVTTIVKGTATITATTDGVDGSATITVDHVTFFVQVTPFDTILFVGESAQFTGVPVDDLLNAVPGVTVSWSSSDESVLTVDADGLVSPVTEGFITITATSDDGGEGFAKVDVVAPTGYHASTLGLEISEDGTMGPYAYSEFEFAGDFSELSYRVHVFNATDVTGATIHLGTEGMDGPVEATMFAPANPTTANGVLAEGTIGVSDLASLTALSDLADVMRSGRAYINVATSADPGGEIRGQVGLPSFRNYLTMPTGSEVVPAVTTSSSALMEFQSRGDWMDYRLSVAISGLTLVHIHLGTGGTNGPVEVTLFDDPAGSFAGGGVTFGEDFSHSHMMTLGSIEELLDRIASGEAYIDLHTLANPDGELRGSIAKSPKLR